MTATLTLLALAACLIVLLTVWAYDRALAELRAERDDLLDVLDDHVEDLTRMAMHRHPSGTNVRVLKAVK